MAGGGKKKNKGGELTGLGQHSIAMLKTQHQDQRGNSSRSPGAIQPALHTRTPVGTGHEGLCQPDLGCPPPTAAGASWGREAAAGQTMEQQSHCLEGRARPASPQHSPNVGADTAPGTRALQNQLTTTPVATEPALTGAPEHPDHRSHEFLAFPSYDPRI